MTDITGIIVIIASIACMLLAQRKQASKQSRLQYSLMGSATAVLIAVESARRGEMSIMLLFALAAAFSIIAVVVDRLNPTNPDA